MNTVKFILSSLIVIVTSANASGDSGTSKTIPFIVHGPTKAYSSTQMLQTSTYYIDAKSVQNVVRQVRDTVCGTVGDADVRVWLSIDIDGKILGVGVEGQSGLEVTFHCNRMGANL